MEELVRAAQDIKPAGRPALRNPELQMAVRSLVSGDGSHGERADIQRIAGLRCHRKQFRPNIPSFPRIGACIRARIAGRHEAAV